VRPLIAAIQKLRISVMRTNSNEQTAASRDNGAKSAGPISEAGKQKSKLNSLQYGLFAKDVVVTAAGEKTRDFNKLEASIRADFQPDGAVQEMLAHDLAVNRWRLARVRRSESADLASRLEDLEIQCTYLRSDDIEALKVQFYLLLEQYCATTNSTPSGELNDIVMRLENARAQLASTSLGLAFLLSKVNEVKTEAESRGQISVASVGTVRACAGIMNEIGLYVGRIVEVNKMHAAQAAEAGAEQGGGSSGPAKRVEPKKGKGKQSRGKTAAEEWKEASTALLVAPIEMVARELRDRKQLMKTIEKWRDKTWKAAAIVPADSTGDRFARAEARYERGFYKALAALLTTKQAASDAKFLP